MATPPGIGLSRFVAAEPPELLNYPGAEFVLIGTAEDGVENPASGWIRSIPWPGARNARRSHLTEKWQ